MDSIPPQGSLVFYPRKPHKEDVGVLFGVLEDFCPQGLWAAGVAIVCVDVDQVNSSAVLDLGLVKLRVHQ